MKKIRYVFIVYFLLLVLIAGAWLYVKRDRFAGMALDPMIEHSLSQLFGSEVKLKDFRFDPISGEISLRRFTVMNPREFSRSPHIDIHHIKTRVNVKELFNKKVLIDEAELGELHYAMERILFDGGTRANCRVMTWNIKDYRKAHAKKPDPSKKDGPSWQLHIQKIWIRGGSFYYRNLVTKDDDDLQFKPLQGHLFDFRYPSNDEILNQDVELTGFFGRQHSVPFWIRGKANFATSNVGFDLQGHIEEGPVSEYKHYWSGMGVRVRGGNFLLNIKGRYKDDYFDSMSTLALKSLKVSAGKTVVSKLWGSPMVGVVKFLESQKMIELQIPVHGDITDPNFEVSQAFRKAFQSAIKTHTKNGISIIKDSTTKIASGATKVSEKIIAGVGTATDIVATELKDQMLGPIREVQAQKEQEEKKANE